MKSRYRPGERVLYNGMVGEEPTPHPRPARVLTEPSLHTGWYQLRDEATGLEVLVTACEIYATTPSTTSPDDVETWLAQ